MRNSFGDPCNLKEPASIGCWTGPGNQVLFSVNFINLKRTVFRGSGLVAEDSVVTCLSYYAFISLASDSLRVLQCKPESICSKPHPFNLAARREGLCGLNMGHFVSYFLWNRSILNTRKRLEI